MIHNLKFLSFSFNRFYFFCFCFLFLLEWIIAFYVHDAIIRPYFGDYLVVILIYCFIRAFLRSPVLPLSSGVLLLAYLVEISQYFHLIFRLGLQEKILARLILGMQFEWMDMVCYTFGFLTILVLENRFQKKRLGNQPFS